MATGIIIIIVLVLLGVLVLFFAYLADSIFGDYNFATSRRAASGVAKIVVDERKEAGKFLDLGSAAGGLALRIKKLIPKLNVQGWDNSGVRVLLAKLRAFCWGRRIFFRKIDFFDAGVSDMDVVYIYLEPHMMPILERKMREELKSGAIVITNSVHFAAWQPNHIYVTHPRNSEKEKLYVYRNNK